MHILFFKTTLHCREVAYMVLEGCKTCIKMQHCKWALSKSGTANMSVPLPPQELLVVLGPLLLLDPPLKAPAPLTLQIIL